MPRPKRSEIRSSRKAKEIMAQIAPEPAPVADTSMQITGNTITRARAKCPLCGLAGEVYPNPHQPSLPSLQEYPYTPKAWRQTFGGYRWDPNRKKRVGVMQYEELEDAQVPLMKVLLAQAYDLCRMLIRMLKDKGVEISSSPQKAVTELGSVAGLWAELDEAYGDVERG